MTRLQLLLCILILTQQCVCFIALIPRVLEDLSTHKDLRNFAQLLRDSENARRILRHRELTILAPTDAAFEDFRGRIDDNLLLYHMLPIALNLEQLEVHAEQKASMQCVSEQLPNLWLNAEGDYLYANDAMVWKNDSNHQSRTREDSYGKLQILHKINKVLSPMLVPMASSTAPTAYDFLAQTSTWPLVTYTLNNYYRRVIMTNSVPLYKEPVSGHTFLIPADEFRSSIDDAAITPEAIKCAIIPTVIFITPTMSNTTYQTLSRDCSVRLHQKHLESHALLDGHQRAIKLLVANIPLKNGVAHVVEQMPGVWRSRMAAIFPMRTLWQQVNNDFYLETHTRLLEAVTAPDVQNLKNDAPKNLTLFVVRDQDWSRFLEDKDLLRNKHLQKFMLRHVSEGVFDLKRLLEVSRTNLRGEILILGLGAEKIIVKITDKDGDVFIQWGLKTIRIVKADVQCSNGIMHVIDAPFIFESEVRNQDDGFNLIHMWKIVTSVMY